MIRRAKRYWASLSPATRLAAYYVLILAAICAAFSIVLYHLALAQLLEGLRHQYMRIHGPDHGHGPLPPIDDTNLGSEFEHARHVLIVRLVYFNILILGLGTFLSYRMAKRTVRPIEEALEAQTRFTADASHELRTPLAAMQTEIDVARRNPKLTKAEALELVESNLEEVAKLKSLTDGLLQLASPGEKGEMKSISIKKAVEEAIKRNQKVAESKLISIESSGNGSKVLVNQQNLVDLLSILVDNAIKYSPRGGRVIIEFGKHGNVVEISVQDQGEGISAKDLPHIFERFYRADSARPNSSGHGLGLSIAKSLAEKNNAVIKVATSRGEGSNFTVTIPLAEN